MQICVLEHVEHDALDGGVFRKKRAYLAHGDLCRSIVWKMKFTRGDAAERDGLQPVLRRKRKTGAIAGGEKLSVLLRQCTVYNRPNRVEHMTRGEIVPCCDLRRARRLGMALPLHEFLTRCAELKPCR